MGHFDGDTSLVAEYAWDFEADGVIDAVSPDADPVTHAYSTEGVFTAVFRVRGALGDQDTASLRAFVSDEVPSGSIGPDTTLSPGEALVIVPSVSDDGRLVRYEWDLDGDGEFEIAGAVTDSVVFAGADAGERVVALRATDEDGRATMFARRIRICTLPPPAAPVWPPNGATNVPVRLTIEWSAAEDCAAPALDDFFFSTNAIPTIVSLAQTSITRFSPLLVLEHNRLYRWRVDRTDAGGRLIASEVYSFRTRPVPPGMSYIPPGNATIGSNFQPDERPPHGAYLEGFYIDRLEVTRAQYAEFIAQTGYTPAGGFRSDFPPDEGDLPATNVTWEDAAAYAAWAGKRLPTEAEWEAAARNRATPRFPWGNQVPFPARFCEYANWTRVDSVACEAGPIPVGSRPVGDTPRDVSDMCGNVAEWVADWYDPAYYARPEALALPVGPSSGSMRVVRGGSWRSLPQDATTTRRIAIDPSIGSDEIGFRCAMSIAITDTLR